jgi:hypothetical protein
VTTHKRDKCHALGIIPVAMATHDAQCEPAFSVGQLLILHVTVNQCLENVDEGCCMHVFRIAYLN